MPGRALWIEVSAVVSDGTESKATILAVHTQDGASVSIPVLIRMP